MASDGLVDLCGDIFCLRPLCAYNEGRVAAEEFVERRQHGQLLLNSLQFALEVWSSRPAVFKNGEMSQQGYANIIKGNYSESGLPLGFFNHCWKAHRYAKVTDACQLQTYHATCEMVAKSKRLAMNLSVAAASTLGCALSRAEALTTAQLHAFSRRARAPARLTMQQQ